MYLNRREIEEMVDIQEIIDAFQIETETRGSRVFCRCLAHERIIGKPDGHIGNAIIDNKGIYCFTCHHFASKTEIVQDCLGCSEYDAVKWLAALAGGEELFQEESVYRKNILNAEQKGLLCLDGTQPVSRPVSPFGKMSDLFLWQATSDEEEAACYKENPCYEVKEDLNGDYLIYKKLRRFVYSETEEGIQPKEQYGVYYSVIEHKFIRTSNKNSPDLESYLRPDGKYNLWKRETVLVFVEGTNDIEYAYSKNQESYTVLTHNKQSRLVRQNALSSITDYEQEDPEFIYEMIKEKIIDATERLDELFLISDTFKDPLMKNEFRKTIKNYKKQISSIF